VGPAGTDPDQELDRLSPGYLIALAARAVRELGGLVRGAERVKKRLATLSVDTVIRFRSPRERAAFTAALEGMDGEERQFSEPGPATRTPPAPIRQRLFLTLPRGASCSRPSPGA